MELFDMHCHLGWFKNYAELACEAQALGLSIFANTVTPQEFVRIRSTLEHQTNVFIGVGAHPWWIADGRLSWEDIEGAADYAYAHAFIGEIGLDFSDRRTPSNSHEIQVTALRTILKSCNRGAQEHGRKIISLHAVKSAQMVLNVLEETGCSSSCECIFHWFSGSGSELHRALRIGCHFSVNEMMLRTRKGREYARQLPAKRLLSETDLPPEEGAVLDLTAIAESLNRSLAQLQDIRGEKLQKQLCENARALLALVGANSHASP